MTKPTCVVVVDAIAFINSNISKGSIITFKSGKSCVVAQNLEEIMELIES